MNSSLWKEICLLVIAGLFVWAVPAKGAMVINEIMYNPKNAGDSLGEWFEIYNPDGALELQGYSISDTSKSQEISTSLIIPLGDYLVFGKSSNLAENGGVNVDYLFSFSLNNSSAETLSILDPGGAVVDSITFGPGTGYPETDGASIYYNGIGDHHQGENWQSAGDLGMVYGLGDFGTPGADNAVSAVPEPGSLLLIGSGIIGILFSRKAR